MFYLIWLLSFGFSYELAYALVGDCICDVFSLKTPEVGSAYFLVVWPFYLALESNWSMMISPFTYFYPWVFALLLSNFQLYLVIRTCIPLFRFLLHQ